MEAKCIDIECGKIKKLLSESFLRKLKIEKKTFIKLK